MRTELAHRTRMKGGEHENDFAELIGGRIVQGTHTNRMNVLDAREQEYSVRAGTWWQLFLLGEDDLARNTIFQGVGNVASIMLDCLNAYPPKYHDYLRDKRAAKQALRPHMRRLRMELSRREVLMAFLERALFDGGKADYLTILPGPHETSLSEKYFHVFRRNDVATALATDMKPANSRARKRGETSGQKVVFKSHLLERQIGEIEDRHDSRWHYRRMRFRLHGPSVFHILKHNAYGPEKMRTGITSY